MKRILICLLALSLLCGAALAEYRVVANCQEWVSLREAPNTASARLKKVPLGATVDALEDVGDFALCEYDGATGYILNEYLEPEEIGGAVSGETLLDWNGARVFAEREYSGDDEVLTVTCEIDGEPAWTCTRSAVATELDTVNAFLGGTADAPRVMVYAAQQGLSCLDPMTGEELWTLTDGEVHLGASQSVAVDDDGTMYIGGYYGPDPVAVTTQGAVLWQADAGSDDTYWLYELQIRDDVLAAHYDQLIEGDAGWVYYDLATGEKLGIERE